VFQAIPDLVAGRECRTLTDVALKGKVGQQVLHSLLAS
jgi:hypothetical protein